MRKYWLGAEYYTATLRPGPRAQDRMVRIPEMWKELDGYLKEAESLVADLPAEQQRFKDRITHQRHGFELARQRSDLRDTMHGARWRRRPRIKPEALTAENRQRFEDFQKWVATTRQHHAQPAGYWPALLPNYYYGRLGARINHGLRQFDAAGVVETSN